MKKHSHFITLLVIIALMLTMAPIEAQAASKSAVLKKANAVTKNLTSYANYHGWEVKVKATKTGKKQVTKKLRVETADGGSYFSFKQVTKKSGKTYFTAKGKKLRLQDVKRSIGLYSNSKTVKSFLKSRSQKAAKSLVSYGKKRSWTAKVTTATKKSNSVSNITFKNKGYSFVATVKVARGKKSPKKSYTLQGKTSTAKVIKSWLEQFRDTTTVTPKPAEPSEKPDTTGTPKPETSTSPTETPEASTAPTTTEEPPQSTTEPSESEVPNGNGGNTTETDLRQLITIYVNDLTMVGKQHNWETTVTEEETKTAILFKNEKWKFDVVVCIIGEQVTYELMGDESDREEIVGWLIKYEVIPTTTTNLPTPTETPDSPTATEQPPQSTTEPTPSGDKIAERVAATIAMNELLIEAAQNGWDHTEVSNTGTSIQYLFRNSQHEFKVSVEARTTDSGEIQVSYVLTTEENSILIDKSLLVSDWFIGLSSNNGSEPTPTPNGPTPIGGGGNSGGSGAGDAQSAPKKN